VTAHYQLIRVYGGVEPALFPEKIPADIESLRKAVVAHLRSEPYDDEDGLYYLEVEGGMPVAVHPFGAMAMEEMRKEAEKNQR